MICFEHVQNRGRVPVLNNASHGERFNNANNYDRLAVDARQLPHIIKLPVLRGSPELSNVIFIIAMDAGTPAVGHDAC